jgi:adenine phosphoribosyltransferase
MSVPATNSDPIADLKKMIREIPDFPKPGILFYDITTLLKEPSGLRSVIDLLTDTLSGQKIDKVVGIEARGFIFAPALAYRIKAGFVPVRKPKKLPSQVESYSYDLEYGKDTVEIHRDSISPGERVVIADDLLATGGTAEAVVRLVEKLGGVVAALAFVVELEFLKGRQRLAGHDVHSLLKYQS